MAGLLQTGRRVKAMEGREGTEGNWEVICGGKDRLTAFRAFDCMNGGMCRGNWVADWIGSWNCMINLVLNRFGGCDWGGTNNIELDSLVHPGEYHRIRAGMSLAGTGLSPSPPLPLSPSNYAC